MAENPIRDEARQVVKLDLTAEQLQQGLLDAPVALANSKNALDKSTAADTRSTTALNNSTNAVSVATEAHTNSQNALNKATTIEKQAAQGVFNGITPHIGANGNWFVGATDTGVKAQGEKGATGEAGADGGVSSVNGIKGAVNNVVFDNTQKIVIGANAVGGGRDVVLGESANSNNNNTSSSNVVFAYNARAYGTQSVAIGRTATTGESTSNATSAVALGNAAKATKDASVAIGSSAKALNNYGVAVGGSSVTEGYKSVSMGYSSNASGEQSIAIGSNASAYKEGANAIGVAASCGGEYSVALGGNASVYANYAAAIGQSTSVWGEGSSAIGYMAFVDEENNVMQLGSADSLSTLRSRVSISVTSDERDKADISGVYNSLDFITRLNPVTFVSNDRTLYISKEDKESDLYRKYGMCEYDRMAHQQGTKKGSRRRIGLLAQETQQALLDVYGTDNYANIVNDNFYDRSTKPNVENKLTIAYSNLVPFLIGAIKEQQEQIDELKTIIKSLTR